MHQVEILSIPNFYSSYYLLGFNNSSKLKYSPEKEFEKFNNRGFIIFRYEGKIGVIDNHDPVGVNSELFEKCHLYFATNKLLGNQEYEQKKVRPIFPHYPVNIISLYLSLFNSDLIFKLKPKDLAREIYVLNSRPKYIRLPKKHHFDNYVFFAGSTWKKEPWANQIRAEFIRTCKSDGRLRFEGGFIPRSDGDNFGYDQEVTKTKYSPRKFSELSSKSLISLNNPAVLGAVSWRLTEYWNASSFVVSFPFAIDLPKAPVQGESIHYVSDSEQFKGVINLVLKDPDYHKKIAFGGHDFFNQYCTPEAQVNYILREMLND